MMVETMLESSQDFGMSNGALPQWKRELLQRRAARTRPAAASAPPQAPPPPPPPADADDEELRYGPGIVKRLKSRYLSLALRDAPRRRPSVLRRATSLEHLLDERPPPAPRPCARAARPVSLAAPPSAAALAAGPPPRRDSVKRARSVDALSRLDRDDHPPIPPKPQPQPQQQQLHQPEPPPLPPSPPPPVNRSARPPRRPTPLLRETERPPPDVVRSALRKFESAPPRRPAPAARVSAVLRGLEALPRSSTPEPRGRSPSPAAADISAIDESEGANQSAEAKLVSRAALEGIARAGSTVRYSFEAPRHGSHLPPLAATNPVLLGRSRLSASPRRVGVIRPMPSPALERSASSPTPPTDELSEKATNESPRILTPPPVENESPPSNRPERKDPPPSAVVEPIPRSAPEETTDDSIRVESDSDASINANNESTPEPEPKIETKPKSENKYDNDPPTIAKTKPLMNGHAERPSEPKTKNNLSRIGAAGIERAWTGAADKKNIVEPKEKKDNGEVKSVVAPWARGAGGGATGARQPRAQPATSVVFNFSNRKEVPDYIENDGIILRANRRNRFKAGEPGIVVLRPEALAPDSDSDAEDEGDGRPPSPCGVRFVNDNVLINGRSSMPGRPNKDRISRLKLQFDDSLTRTFEYPSETSLCEESPGTPAAAPPAAPLATPAAAPPDGEPGEAEGELVRQPALLATLTSNTHIASASLARYTPSKTRAAAFELGLARPAPPPAAPAAPAQDTVSECAEAEAEAGGGAAGDARPCAAHAARSWSEARTHATDLLF